MVADPMGHFTTWVGVGYDVWHHGRSGIGTSQLPPVHSDVAVYAIGDILTNGRLLISGVPIHVMANTKSGKSLELHVGSDETPITWIPDRHFRIVWNEYSDNYSRAADFAQYAWAVHG